MCVPYGGTRVVVARLYQVLRIRICGRRYRVHAVLVGTFFDQFDTIHRVRPVIGAREFVMKRLRQRRRSLALLSRVEDVTERLICFADLASAVRRKTRTAGEQGTTVLAGVAGGGEVGADSGREEG